MRLLLFSAVLAMGASAQTTPAAGCDAGAPMPTPFPAEAGAAEIDVQLSGPEPVAIPNLCDTSPIVALDARTGPSDVRIWEGPVPMSDLDRLRQRYDVFRERIDPDLLLRLDPLAPGPVRFLRDVEPYGLRDRWIPYPDLHAPARLLVLPDLVPQAAPSLPLVAPGAGRP